MKRVNNIYDNICDLNNIMSMSHKVCINTKNKNKVDKYELYLTEHLIDIKNLLSNKTYKIGKYNIFLIREPKLRLIMSQSIADKVVNHLVAKYFLVDVFDKSFIDSSIATRKGKGTHYGMMLLKKYINEMKKKYDNIYVLKFDIKKYFYNIDHEIVKKIISTKIKDKNAISLINKIIDSTDEEYVNDNIVRLKNNEINKIKQNININEVEKNRMIEEINSVPLYEKGKGCPIGNYTSQTIAILYLSELDHYIKEKLHIKAYIRYMDDGVLLHNDKKYLEYCLIEIKNILMKYKLELNEKKTQINSIKNGIDFLGYKYYLKNNIVIMKLRDNTKKKFRKYSKDLVLLYKYDLLNKKELKCVIASYKGHLKWGNCNNLYYKNLLQYLN